MTSNNPYDNYRQALREKSPLTRKEDLDKAWLGRSRYDPETLKPLPFPGISVIHNIDDTTALELELSPMAKGFKQSLINAGIGNKFAFVSLNSFHATTFDLINEVEHSEKLIKQEFEYLSIRPNVEKAAINFLRDRKLKISAKTIIEGIGMFAKNGVVKLNLGLDDSVKNIFQTYRVELNKYLVEEVAGYSVIRNDDWNQTLSGHITFGYIVNSLTDEEIEIYLERLKTFNDGFKPISFELTQGEVTQFTDMDNYTVVPY